MMRTSRMNERGIALVVAIFALVVIGALVAGTFLLGQLEQRVGRSTVYLTQASEAADAGLAKALEQGSSALSALNAWTPTATNTDLALGTTSLGGNQRFTPTIRRLNSSLFLVQSVGERLGSGGQVLATERHGLLIRLVKATIGVNSAITVMQPIQLNGNAFGISGINANPPGWQDNATGWTPCPDVTNNGDADDMVGIRSSSSTGVGSQDADNIVGYPVDAVANDPTITSATFQNFVDRTFATMTSQIGTKTLPLTSTYSAAPVVTGGVCDKTALTNFGEPTHPSPSSASACYNYFPVVNGTGATTKFAANSRGQGTLLINGDLEIAGNFQWTGLVIVRGSFKITGNGNKIVGAVLAESVTDDNMIGGNVDIQYSSCAIAKAVEGAAVAQPLTKRSWTQLY